MFLLMLTGGAALVPSILIAWYFHSRDAHPEPAKVLWATFGLGVLSIIPAVLVALSFEVLLRQVTNPYLHGAGQAFFGAALPEEAFKFLVVYLYAARHRAFDEPMDGIVYGVMAALQAGRSSRSARAAGSPSGCCAACNPLSEALNGGPAARLPCLPLLPADPPAAPRMGVACLSPPPRTRLPAQPPAHQLSGPLRRRRGAGAGRRACSRRLPIDAGGVRRVLRE